MTGSPADAESLHPGTRRGTYRFTPGRFLALRTELDRNRHRRSDKLPDYETRLIDGRPVRHIASLGTHCVGSLILQNAGLKRYSLPFDWIHSTPGLLHHCIQHDFAGFLPDIGADPSAAGGTIEQRFGIPEVFMHRSPRTAEGRAYYTRAVARFRRLLASRDAKLFLMIARPFVPIEWHFQSLVQLLDRHTSHHQLIAIQLLPVQAGRCGIGMDLVAQVGEHRLFNFRPASDESKLGYFPDVIDELLITRLVHQYRLDLAATV